MNAFTDGKEIEARGMAVLLPFLRERAHDGQLVLCNKGPLAKVLQESVGDLLFNTDPDRIWSVEVKIERSFTGNFFFETWSNKNLEDAGSHYERGSNPGWLIKSRAELLMNYFLDTDQLFTFPLFRLQRWAFNVGRGQRARIYDFPEVKQTRHVQLNDTWGHLVSIEKLREELKFSELRVRQLPLPLQEAAE